MVQIISCSVRGSRLLLEDQNTDCTLIPNPIDLRGWVSCTQFQQNSLTSGHVFGPIFDFARMTEKVPMAIKDDNYNSNDDNFDDNDEKITKKHTNIMTSK